jgi:EAL domain-containing protein (putative c-di-GMP-specific phosphodiesterase class I)
MSFLSKRKIYSAINNGEFYVMYQPIYNNVTQLFDCVEVFLRWRNNAGVEINPLEFISQAESSGCIIPLTLHLFHLVRDDIKSWSVMKDISISLNVSGLHFQSQFFINDIFSLVQGMPKNINFILELTERYPLPNHKQMVQLFNRLKVMGLALSLDDFGSGYSNIDTLSKYHFDYVKLSGDLLNEIDSNERSLSIVTGCLSLIASINAIAVIENIETDAQYSLLKRNPCLFQGFFLSKPLLKHEFLRFMEMDDLEF